MPDDQQTLGDAVEDAYYASSGVRTGSAFSDALVSQREQYRQINADGFSVSGGGGGEGIFSVIDDLFDLIPPIVYQIVAALGLIGGLSYGLYIDLGWFSIVTGFGGAGAALFSIVLLRIVAKLAYLALGIGIGIGLIWLFMQIFGSQG